MTRIVLSPFPPQTAIDLEPCHVAIGTPSNVLFEKQYDERCRFRIVSVTSRLRPLNTGSKPSRAPTIHANRTAIADSGTLERQWARIALKRRSETPIRTHLGLFHRTDKDSQRCSHAAFD